MARLVIIESPYAGDVDGNLGYLRRCMRDSLMRGEAPFASHGLYTQTGVLDDNDPAQRGLGISAGWEWMKRADLVAVYADRGISSGMLAGIKMAALLGVAVEHRYLDTDPEAS